MCKHCTLLALTLLCGVGIVTCETPVNLLLLFVWTVVTVISLRRIPSSPEPSRRRHLACLHLGAIAIVVALALLTPVKRIDAMLRQSIELPQEKATLRELAEFCREQRQVLPIRNSLPSGGTFAKSPVTFPGRIVSVQQFIDAIEQQTGCRHHIGGCGNAYTILYGHAYNFGLLFRPRDGADYTWD